MSLSTAKTRINALWHSDADGMNRPENLVGQRFLHVATSNLYVVTSFHLAVGDNTAKWTIVYEREDENHRGDFAFSRSMKEFLDGRFVKVK